MKYFKIIQGDFCYYFNDLQKQACDNIMQEQKDRGYNNMASDRVNIELLRQADFAINTRVNSVIKLRNSVEYAFDKLLGISDYDFSRTIIA